MDSIINDHLRETDLLFAAVSATLGSMAADGTPRSEVAASLCAVVLEHGIAIRALVELRQLIALDRAAPPPIGRMLRGLKDGAWKPLNSYVHGGIHPVTQQLYGYSDEYVIQTLRNANGLSTMAAMLLAVMSNDSRAAEAIRRTQLEYRDCLPPLLDSK